MNLYVGGLDSCSGVIGKKKQDFWVSVTKKLQEIDATYRTFSRRLPKNPITSCDLFIWKGHDDLYKLGNFPHNHIHAYWGCERTKCISRIGGTLTVNCKKHLGYDMFRNYIFKHYIFEHPINNTIKDDELIDKVADIINYYYKKYYDEGAEFNIDAIEDEI